MSAPTNIRIQRLQQQNTLLENKLRDMTSIAETLNVQLNRFYLTLGHAKFKRIAETPLGMEVLTMKGIKG